MDRVQIKERAKVLLKKDQGACIAVAVLVTLLSGAGGGSVSFTSSTSGASSGASATLNDEAVISLLIFSLVAMVIGVVVAFAITAFVGSQVKVGSCRFFLKHRKNHPVEIGELFKSYSDKTFLNVAKVSVIKDVQIMLWTMLCFIPGIIKTYEYAAVPYILSVNPTMDYKRALDLSKRIMNGHKMELFELYISFFGWFLLSIFTCGILSIVYVMPYYLISEAEFFAYVRENAIFNGVISPADIPDYDEFIPQANMYGYGAPNGGYYQQPTQGYAPTQPVANSYAPFNPMQPVAPIEVPVTPVEPVAPPANDTAPAEPVAPIEPIEAPAEEPIEAPAEEPIEAPAEEPIEAPAEEPIEAPAEEPIEAPAEEPIEAPADEPNGEADDE